MTSLYVLPFQSPGFNLTANVKHDSIIWQSCVRLSYKKDLKMLLAQKNHKNVNAVFIPAQKNHKSKTLFECNVKMLKYHKTVSIFIIILPDK